jgi:hypothetical protein
VSCTPTSILADGTAGYFVFKAGTGRFGAEGRARPVRLFRSATARAPLVAGGTGGRFFTRRLAGGMGGRGRGGAASFSSLRGRGRGSLAESVLLVAFTCSGRFHSGF